MLCLAVKALGAVFGEHLVLCLVSTWCFSFVFDGCMTQFNWCCMIVAQECPQELFCRWFGQAFILYASKHMQTNTDASV